MARIGRRSRRKYAALLPCVKTRLDLNYIIGEMIGELGVGHAYEPQRWKVLNGYRWGCYCSRQEVSQDKWFPLGKTAGGFLE